MDLVEFAEKVDLTQGYLSNIELGVKIPSIKKLIQIADVLGVSKLYLFKAAGYLDETDILNMVDENKRLRDSLKIIERICEKSEQIRTNDDLAAIENVAYEALEGAKQ